MDAGTPGTASGTSANSVVSPSLDGFSRQFNLTSNGGGGERFSNYFGTNNLDTTSTVWQYVTSIYTPAGNNAHVGRYELDINHTRADGTTDIIGWRCNFSSSTWDYTIEVTPTTSTWVHSSVACIKAGWPENQFNSIVLNAHTVGVNTCYDSIVFNGVTSVVNQCVNSNFSIGFVPVGLIQINFQLDGDGASFSTTVYQDETAVNRY